MDDAVVDYSRSAGLLNRFRQSTFDKPVASGSFMRPSVPSTNVLAARVSHELELVRNRMFRLDSMLKEAGQQVDQACVFLFLCLLDICPRGGVYLKPLTVTR